MFLKATWAVVSLGAVSSVCMAQMMPGFQLPSAHNNSNPAFRESPAYRAADLMRNEETLQMPCPEELMNQVGKRDTSGGWLGFFGGGKASECMEQMGRVMGSAQSLERLLSE